VKAQTIKLALVLFVAAGISAATLSLIYSVTKPRIEEFKVKKLQSDLEKVLESAASFEQIVPDTVWRGLGTSGETVGIAFKVFPKGYGGPIETLVGVNTDSTVAGIVVASPAEGMKETPGLGIKVTEDWFREQFKGRQREELLLKKDGGELDGVTAATISSRAVVNGVREGLLRYAEYLLRTE
jgi:electron transport complex protein RnfG